MENKTYIQYFGIPQHFGLKKQKSDIRDLSRHKKFGSISPASLPPDGLHRPKMKSENQNGTAQCTCYTVAGMRGTKYNRLFSTDWFSSQEAKLEGWNGHFEGAGLRDAALLMKNKGILPRELSPLSWQQNGADYVANPANWNPALDAQAVPFKCDGFMTTDGPYDTYDNIRVALQMHDTDGEGVLVGISWFQEWNFEFQGRPSPADKILPAPTSASLNDHAIRINDWNEKGLIVDAHLGTQWGDGGVMYLPRELANKYIFGKEGPFIFLDGVEYEQLKREQWGILESLKNILVQLWKKLWPTTPLPIIPIDQDLPPPAQPIPPAPPIPPTPKYDWSNPVACRHSARVIMDESNLLWKEKDLLCDICQCESGFNPKAKLVNNPNSIDRGLFQWNNLYHPEITDEMAYNPETAVRLACKALKNKQVKTFWSASMKCWNKDGKYDDLLV